MQLKWLLWQVKATHGDALESNWDFCIEIDMEVGLNRHIEITPGVRSGKPRIAGTRITVADVATMYLQMVQSLEEIAGKYQLSLAAVYAPIAFYYDHRTEIARRTAEAEAFAAPDRRHRNSFTKLG